MTNQNDKSNPEKNQTPGPAEAAQDEKLAIFMSPERPEYAAGFDYEKALAGATMELFNSDRARFQPFTIVDAHWMLEARVKQLTRAVDGLAQLVAQEFCRDLEIPVPALEEFIEEKLDTIEKETGGRRRFYPRDPDPKDVGAS